MLRIRADAASTVWQALLSLRRQTAASSTSPPPDVIAIAHGENGWHCTTASVAGCKEVLWVSLNGPLPAIETRSGDPANAAGYDHDRFLAGQDPLVSLRGALDTSIVAILRMYLPCIVGAYRAQRAGEVFVLAHLAQTLDGRIACLNGQSQWISNQANLLHAHRLRALHDAVLVGGKTVTTDDPLLTVRHVDGDDPERIVLSATASVLRTDASYKVFEGAGCTVLCGNDALDGLALNGRHGRVRIVPLACDGELITPTGVRDALVERGISSVFIEGG